MRSVQENCYEKKEGFLSSRWLDWIFSCLFRCDDDDVKGASEKAAVEEAKLCVEIETTFLVHIFENIWRKQLPSHLRAVLRGSLAS